MTRVDVPNKAHIRLISARNKESTLKKNIKKTKQYYNAQYNQRKTSCLKILWPLGVWKGMPDEGSG